MLPSRRLFYKQADFFPKLFCSKAKGKQVNASGGEKIVIPPRIERKPTDILKALSSTVGLDPTAFHYRYPDDPYLYPYTVIDKKVLALSLESGRKSAKWVFKENPGFFKQQLSDPQIEAFLPKEVIDEDVTEQSLLNAIEERNVLGAIETYKALKDKGEDVSKSTMQSLLELACFYNSKPKPDLELDSKWFVGFLGKNAPVKEKQTWDEEHFVQSLFEEMDQSCPLAVSAVIQGMLKYGEIQSALKLYESAKVKKMKLSVGVYNALLSETSEILTKRGDTLVYVKEKLNEMAETGIKPDLGTLNGALRSFSRLVQCNMAFSFVLECLKMNIAPSLGSYAYLFKVLARLKPNEVEKSVPRTIAWNLLQVIGSRPHEIQHPCDFEFFSRSMDCFSQEFVDADLALELVDIYFRFDNSKFVVRSEDENGFLKQLMNVVLKEKPFEEAMTIYRQYVYTWYNPSVALLSELFVKIQENYAPEYLPRLWDDIQKMDLNKNRVLLGRLLNLVKDFTDESSLKIFHQAATSYLQRLNQEKDTPFREGYQMENIILAFIKNDDEKMVLEVIKAMQEFNLEFLYVTESLAETFVDFALSKENPSLILESLKLSSEYNFPFTEEKVEKALPLLSDSDGDMIRGFINKKGRRKKAAPWPGKEKTAKENGRNLKQEVDVEEEEETKTK